MYICLKKCNMNLETRKIEFIQEFLKIKSEEAISRFESLLKKENSIDSESITKASLNMRINHSESDFQNNRFKESSELLEKYK